MEMKNTQAKMTFNLLLSSLKEKRNWFFVSLIIMLVTLVLIPIILGFKVTEGILIAGILEIAFLLFVSALIDFSYLHDSRKLTWYMSKPVSKMQRVNTLILSNLVFLASLLLLLFAIGFFSVTNIKFEYIRDIYLVGFPWLLIELFVIALSSLLTGNTIAAGIASVVNFTMPLSLLAIINYGFNVIGHFAAGFNPRILFNNFVEKFYKIDAIYFVKYVNDNFSPIYFLILAVWLLVFYGLSIFIAKRRKNERTGDFVVVDGYKYLVALLLASLVPIGFSAIFYENSIAEKLLSFVILFGLTYYLINAVLEKSFKLKSFAVKLSVAFILVFLTFVGISNITAGKFVSKLPQIDEVEAVYLDRSTYIYSQEYRTGWNIYNISLKELEEKTDVALYRDRENIENIINFHKEATEEQDYYYSADFNIVYFYKDGQTLSRYYKFKKEDGTYTEKDKYLSEIIKSDEFKINKMPFIYDENYLKDRKIRNLSIYYERMDPKDKYISDNLDIYENQIDLDLIREYLKKDLSQLVVQPPNILSYFLIDEYGYRPYDWSWKEEGNEGYVIQIEFQAKGELGSPLKEGYFNFKIGPEYSYTFNYLDKIRSGKLDDNSDKPEQIL